MALDETVLQLALATITELKGDRSMLRADRLINLEDDGPQRWSPAIIMHKGNIGGWHSGVKRGEPDAIAFVVRNNRRTLNSAGDRMC